MCERVPRGKDRAIGEGVAPRGEPRVGSKAGQYEYDALDSSGADVTATFLMGFPHVKNSKR